MTRAHRILLTATLALAAAWPSYVRAQVDEYGVKAAFVRNFIAFVDWPPSRLAAADALQLCVYNSSPITPKLTALNMDAVKGHRVQVRAIAAIPELGGCHVVFVPTAERTQLGDIHSRYRGSGLLTISEETTERSGAVINMYVAGNKMTFDVDLAAADALSVRVSSKLAALAHRVHGASTPARGFSD